MNIWEGETEIVTYSCLMSGILSSDHQINHVLILKLLCLQLDIELY